MKLETTAGMLKAALNVVAPAIERRNMIPILGTVKFDGKTVEGTNLDMVIRADLPARIARGALCVPFHPLFALVRQIAPDDVVTIEGGTADSESTARISFGLSSYDLLALPVADYPTLDLPDMAPVRIDGDAFKKALRFVAPSISTEETRYYLNGVYLDGDLAVATDGHRAAVHPLGFSLGESRGIVPVDAIRALLGLPPMTTLAIGPGRYVFKGPGVTLSGKLIDGTYPDWRRVVPRFENDFQQVSVDRALLRKALARLSAVQGDARAVTIAWADDVLSAVTMGLARTFGREELSIPVSSMGGGGRFSVNLRYFLAALTLLGREVVDIRMNDRGSPVMMEGENGAFMLVMPMGGSAETDKVASAMLTAAASRKLTEVAA